MTNKNVELELCAPPSKAELDIMRSQGITPTPFDFAIMIRHLPCKCCKRHKSDIQIVRYGKN